MLRSTGLKVGVEDWLDDDVATFESRDGMPADATSVDIKIIARFNKSIGHVEIDDLALDVN